MYYERTPQYYEALSSEMADRGVIKDHYGGQEGFQMDQQPKISIEQ